MLWIIVSENFESKESEGQVNHPDTKPVFTAELVDKHYSSLRSVWEPFAKRAVDRAFKSVAKDHGLVQWRPTVEFTKVKMKAIHGSPAKSRYYLEVLDDLEEAFWDQDVGWEGSEQAYESMCKKMKMEPAPECDPLGGTHGWATAWNAYQRRYAKATYGVDINFGN